MVPLPKPHLLGTPVLRASPTSLGASIVPQCLLAVDTTALVRVSSFSFVVSSFAVEVCDRQPLGASKLIRDIHSLT